jgi:hypothetical protein
MYDRVYNNFTPKTFMEKEVMKKTKKIYEGYLFDDD